MARDTTRSHTELVEERAYALGIHALLWGRPLPEYLKTHEAALAANSVRVNYWHKFPILKTAKDRYVVTPNNVSIDAYGIAVLSGEPVVINVPALSQPRWYIVQIGDMFDEIVQNIGGHKGQQPGLYLLTGPDYHGPIPATLTEIKVGTQFAAVALRVYVNGEADLPAARDGQSGFHMLPLSVFQREGLRFSIPETEDFTLSVSQSAPEDLAIFEQIGNGMRLFLSTSDDVGNPLIASFHQIGLSVTRGFEWESLDDPTKRGLARAAVAGEQIIDDAYEHSAEIIDGWRYTMSDGRAGHDLALRAALVKYVLGGNVPEELVYPNVRVDAQGEELTGKRRYELRFEKGETPPASVLWNLAMYDAEEFFIDNDLGRYTIGSTTDGLQTAEDGSITLYVQHEHPGNDKESNWLPAPSEGFNLTMRLYGAEPSFLNGSYHLPPVQRL